jgi:AraC-like DNA-binding protein
LDAQRSLDGQSPQDSPSPQSSPSSDNNKLVDNEAKTQELYDRACELMEHERLYTDPQLNRERLAELLGTNRTYLSAIIKEKSGMSYLQFVNSYRINEAVRILSDPEKIDYPLKQIWSDLGFNSPATFYKLFQQAVGITPSVYRKQFIDLNND